ncbi:adenosylcobinamide-GDP ribazoletransferase [Nocardioides gansuensis]|uniref:Adenosylcobinamide-GDP ribazoletransferase n=1 Tax=Nocardioides gansuensis TaxID=2138300 RepID=A0A2T8FF69_9ACTN|nr:adenosylcobinamide-GDP ribazoletransferase [Nocardioides gansuensis]PVG84368.1 adenosylcobinamide-GDP ribazoletransferase [Nocardioides gansuensis]
MTRDGWRLAVGTLTAMPCPPPGRVDPRVAARSVVLGPVAVLPLALLVTGVLAGGRQIGITSLALGFVAVGALALGSRAFHLDGLADTADGLTASYDRARSLAVMKSGDVGPAGAAALVVVLGVQATALATVHPLLAVLAVCLSRWGHAAACARGSVAATPGGLGAAYAGSLGPAAVALLLVVAGAALAGGAHLAGLPWWRGAAGVLLAALAVTALARRAHRRLGGVNGDVMGASIEVSLALLLVAVA